MNFIFTTSKVLLFTLLFSSCATMFNNSPQSINVNTADGKKDVAIQVTTSSGVYTTTIPSAVTADASSKGVTVRVVDKKYIPTTVEVNRSVTPSFWANFLWGFAFPVGMIVDAATGNMWKYDPNIIIPLAPVESSSDKERVPTSLDTIKN
ncbi:MAG: hypothetical protein HQK53_16285 [Oligoflexia bacterium]|nr:hypothetical protein [Oligoflexia bacterium]